MSKLFFDTANLPLKNSTDTVQSRQLFGSNHPEVEKEPFWEVLVDVNPNANNGIIYSPYDGLFYVPTSIPAITDSLLIGYDANGNIVNSFPRTQPQYQARELATFGNTVYQSYSVSQYGAIDLDSGAETIVGALPVGAVVYDINPVNSPKTASNSLYSVSFESFGANVGELTTTRLSDGKIFTQTPNTVLGRGIAVDGAGNIIVADTNNLYKLQQNEVAGESSSELSNQFSQMPGEVHCIKIIASSIDQLSQPMRYVVKSNNRLEEKILYPSMSFNARCSSQPVVDICFPKGERPIINGDSYFNVELLPQSSMHIAFKARRIDPSGWQNNLST